MMSLPTSNNCFQSVPAQNKYKINYKIFSAEEITERIQELTEPKHFCTLLLLCATELNNENDTNFNATNIVDALEQLVFFIPIVKESISASNTVIETLLKAAISRVDEFSPSEVSVVIESISALNSESSIILSPGIKSELMNLLADKVVEMIKRDNEIFSTSQMTAIARSFSLMKIMHINLFESLARVVPIKINCFTSEKTFGTLIAFSVYTILNPQPHHGFLFQSIAHRVSQKINEYDANEITSVALTFINVTYNLARVGVLIKILDLSYEIEKAIVEKKLSCSNEQLSIIQKMFEQQRAILYQQCLFEAVVK